MVDTHAQRHGPVLTIAGREIFEALDGLSDLKHGENGCKVGGVCAMQIPVSGRLYSPRQVHLQGTTVRSNEDVEQEL